MAQSPALAKLKKTLIQKFTDHALLKVVQQRLLAFTYVQ